jgi:hypothetical protein
MEAASPGDDPSRAVWQLERFIGVLIEHFAARFLVAGTVQVWFCRLPTAHNEYSHQVAQSCWTLVSVSS